MADTRKVFILNTRGTSPESRDDLFEFFTTSTKIFSSKPDVKIVDNVSFNFDDLNSPIFVQGGGASGTIGKNLKYSFQCLENYYYSYVGICAGGYVAVNKARLYLLNEKDKSFTYNHLYDTDSFKSNLNIIDDFDAVGPFIPNDTQPLDETTPYVPYCVNINLNDGTKLPQLYVQGPGFFPNNKTPKTEMVATFKEANQFKLFPSTFNTNTEVAAIIKRSPSASRGGLFLSSTHSLEAAVQNSKFVNAFKEKTDGIMTLQQSDLDLLASNQQTAKEKMENLLNETLNNKNRNFI